MKSAVTPPPHHACDFLCHRGADGASARFHQENAKDAEVGPGLGIEAKEGADNMGARKKKGRIGSSFNDFLKDEGLNQEASAVAIKRVLAWQLENAMAKEGVTKNEMAKRMRTSRSQLERILDPDNDKIQLDTVFKAARVLGRELRLELV
jgi:hypothetical protein